MRFKWLNSRVTNIEQILENGQHQNAQQERTIPKLISQQQQHSDDLQIRVSNVEAQLQMCQHVYSRLEF